MATKILVIMDPQQDRQSAFDRAVELAHLVKVSLHLVLFTDGNEKELPVDSNNQADSSAPEPNYVHRCQLWLEDLTRAHVKEGLEITTEVKSFHRLHEAVIQTAIEQDAIFIFKPMRHHSLVKRTLYTPTDWNLIRTCPFPLLLINDARPLNGRAILAAVKIGVRDSDHDDLNRIIMSQAAVIGRLFNSNIHVVNAVPLPSIPMGYSATEPTGYEVIKGLQKDHLARAIALAEEFEMPEDSVTVIEGQAELLVNKLAEQLDAGIVILGSVARSGLTGLFIGNTAERVLEESSTDVMVLKQADFASPLQKDA